jgi:hypothetical protein
LDYILCFLSAFSPFVKYVIVHYFGVWVLLHSSVDLATGAALLSLYVSKLNLMEMYQYTQEQMMPFIYLYFKNCSIINDVFSCHSLLSFCSCRLCLLFWSLLMFLYSICNWPEGCCAITLLWLKTLCGNIAWKFNQKIQWSLGGETCFFLCYTQKNEAAAFSETIQLSQKQYSFLRNNTAFSETMVNTCETVCYHIL